MSRPALLERYRALPLPSTTDEPWRFTDLKGFDPEAFEKNRAIEDRRNEDRFHFINWTKKAFKNVDVIPPGNGIMHQINLEKMSPVIQVRDGVDHLGTADRLDRRVLDGGAHRCGDRRPAHSFS